MPHLKVQDWSIWALNTRRMMRKAMQYFTKLSSITQLLRLGINFRAKYNCTRGEGKSTMQSFKQQFGQAIRINTFSFCKYIIRTLRTTTAQHFVFISWANILLHGPTAEFWIDQVYLYCLLEDQSTRVAIVNARCYQRSFSSVQSF